MSEFPTKKCKDCSCIYPATKKFFNRAGKGLCSYCKQCHCKRARAWYKANYQKKDRKPVPRKKHISNSVCKSDPTPEEIKKQIEAMKTFGKARYEDVEEDNKRFVSGMSFK